MKKESIYEYLFVKNDGLELPIITSSTIDGLVEKTGYNFDCIYKAVCRNSLIAGQFKVVKVDVREPEEKFNWQEYKLFCSKEGLRENNFKSLQKFRNDCYGVA